MWSGDTSLRLTGLILIPCQGADHYLICSWFTCSITCYLVSGVFKVNGFLFISSSEVWFDDVDPEDLEQITGSKRIKTTSDQDPNEILVTGSIEGLVSLKRINLYRVG